MLLYWLVSLDVDAQKTDRNPYTKYYDDRFRDGHPADRSERRANCDPQPVNCHLNIYANYNVYAHKQ